MLKCTRVYTVQFLKYLSLGISWRVEWNHSARAKDVSLTGLLLQLLSYVLQRWILKHVIQPMHWSLGKGSGWPSSSLPHHNPLPGTEREDERILEIQFPGPTPDILNPKLAMDPALWSLTAPPGGSEAQSSLRTTVASQGANHRHACEWGKEKTLKTTED